MVGQDLDSDGEGDGRSGKGRDGDKGDKKGIINRVNRKLPPHNTLRLKADMCRSLCKPSNEHLLTGLMADEQNNCRRMKMRCVGAEDPPCKRCRNAGLECVMEKPGRSANDGVGEE